MKKWKKRLAAIAVQLGLIKQLEAGSLTADEQKQIFAEYEKAHSISFASDMALDEDDDPAATLLSAEQQKEIAALLGKKTEEAPKKTKEAVTALSGKVEEQNKVIEKLEATPEVATALEAVLVQEPKKTMGIVLGAAPHTANHLFGIEHEIFARSSWHGNLFVTRKETADTLTQEDKKSFMATFQSYATQLKERVQSLDANNQLSMLDYGKMLAGESHIDYSSLTGTAGEYVVRRTDLILAYLRSLPSVGHIFPIVSHVQNKEIAPNANFGELSQGYREGRHFKGNVKFSAEVYKVTDLMFKFKFEDLIKLEKMYIGYLNREGSNVIKWTLIEWIMVHFGQILHSEQQRRRVAGVAVPQQDVIANPADFGADGALRAIERVEEELKVLPFEDLTIYDSTSIVDYFESMWDKVNEILPSMEGYKFYANGRHKQWYLRQFRAKYQLANDFTGGKTQLIDLTPEAIVWVPNMPMNCFKAWITLPGNIENYEDRPNEMNAFYFERDFEVILTLSRWKEGSGLLRAGVQYKTLAELEASERKLQWIFTNFPASDLTLADTVSFKENALFLIEGSTTVTTVTGYDTDRVYKLIASDANVKLQKEGVFSKIEQSFTAKAKGDYIKVYAELEDYTQTVDGKSVKMTRATGKFKELERKVTTA